MDEAGCYTDKVYSDVFFYIYIILCWKSFQIHLNNAIKFHRFFFIQWKLQIDEWSLLILWNCAKKPSMFQRFHWFLRSNANAINSRRPNSREIFKQKSGWSWNFHVIYLNLLGSEPLLPMPTHHSIDNWLRSYISFYIL